MADVKIRLRAEGPYVIEGDFLLVDAAGTPIPLPRKPVALCRCGASLTKPFCDGSHRTHGIGPGAGE